VIDRAIAITAGQQHTAVILLLASAMLFGARLLFRIFRRLLISAVAAICIAVVLVGFSCREVRHRAGKRIMLLRVLKHP